MPQDDMSISDLKRFMDERFVSMEERMVSKGDYQNLKDDHDGLMEFLQEHMVTKEEFNGLSKKSGRPWWPHRPH